MSSTPGNDSSRSRPPALIRTPLKLLGLYHSVEDVVERPVHPRLIERPNIFAGRQPNNPAAPGNAAGPSKLFRLDLCAPLVSQPIPGFPPLPQVTAAAPALAQPNRIFAQPLVAPAPQPQAPDAAGPSRPAPTQPRQQPVTAPYKHGQHRSQLERQRPRKLRRTSSFIGSSFVTSSLDSGLSLTSGECEPRIDFAKVRDINRRFIRRHPSKVTPDLLHFTKELDKIAKPEVLKKMIRAQDPEGTVMPLDQLREKRQAEKRRRIQEEEAKQRRLHQERMARKQKRLEERRLLQEEQEMARLRKERQEREEREEQQRRMEELERIRCETEEKQAALLQREAEEERARQRRIEELEKIQRQAQEKLALQVEKAKEELRWREDTLKAEEQRLKAERLLKEEEDQALEKCLIRQSRDLRELQRAAEAVKVKASLDARAREIEESLQVRALREEVQARFPRGLRLTPSFYPMEVDEVQQMSMVPEPLPPQETDHYPPYIPAPPPPIYPQPFATNISVHQPSPLTGLTPQQHFQPNTGINIQIFNGFHHVAN